MSGIYDITPFSLLDFPGIPSAIVWFSGCNLRCIYCYNPDIVLGDGRISEEQLLGVLQKRIGFLEGIVLSGGEATLYPNILEFVTKLKSLGYKIKLDTNAMRPDILKILLDHTLLDYVALDYKAPSSKMEYLCGTGSEEYFWRSFDLLQRYNLLFEVRTTLHPDLLDEEDIINMAQKLKSKGYIFPYYVQPYRNDVETLGNISNPSKTLDMARLSTYVTLRA